MAYGYFHFEGLLKQQQNHLLSFVLSMKALLTFSWQFMHKLSISLVSCSSSAAMSRKSGFFSSLFSSIFYNFRRACKTAIFTCLFESRPPTLTHGKEAGEKGNGPIRLHHSATWFTFQDGERCCGFEQSSFFSLKYLYRLINWCSYNTSTTSNNCSASSRGKTRSSCGKWKE